MKYNMRDQYDYSTEQQTEPPFDVSYNTSPSSSIMLSPDFPHSPIPSPSPKSTTAEKHKNSTEQREELLISPRHMSNFDWETAAADVASMPLVQANTNNYYYGGEDGDGGQHSAHMPLSLSSFDINGNMDMDDHSRISRRASCPGTMQPSLKDHDDVFSQHTPQLQARGSEGDDAAAQQFKLPPHRNNAQLRRSTITMAPPASMYSEPLQTHAVDVMKHNAADTANVMPESPSGEELISNIESASTIHPDFPFSQDIFDENQKQPLLKPNQVSYDQNQNSLTHTHPTTLSISTDHMFLNPIHNFLRSTCIEVFVAGDHHSGRGAQAHQIGQVGLRCGHCKHVHRSKRAKQAVSYPSKTINIFESVRNFQRTHFEACEYIPDELKVRHEKLKLELYSYKKVQQKYIKAYYAEAGCEIGLMDTPNGIIFGAPPNLSGKPSKKLLIIMKIAENPSASAHLEDLIFPKVDRRFENMKFSHVASENTRQVIDSCRQQKTVFVHPSDFPTISDFRFVLFHQFGPCRPPNTALNRRRTKPEKWDTLSGLCCRYCAKAYSDSGGRNHRGMYFPLDLVSLYDSSLSHNLTTHLMTCQHTPLEIKQTLEELQRLAAEVGATTKRGSKKMFLQKLWQRMANFYPAPR